MKLVSEFIHSYIKERLLVKTFFTYELIQNETSFLLKIFTNENVIEFTLYPENLIEQLQKVAILFN